MFDFGVTFSWGFLLKANFTLFLKRHPYSKIDLQKRFVTLNALQNGRVLTTRFFTNSNIKQNFESVKWVHEIFNFFLIEYPFCCQLKSILFIYFVVYINTHFTYVDEKNFLREVLVHKYSSLSSPWNREEWALIL